MSERVRIAKSVLSSYCHMGADLSGVPEIFQYFSRYTTRNPMSGPNFLRPHLVPSAQDINTLCNIMPEYLRQGGLGSAPFICVPEIPELYDLAQVGALLTAHGWRKFGSFAALVWSKVRHFPIPAGYRIELSTEKELERAVGLIRKSMPNFPPEALRPALERSSVIPATSAFALDSKGEDAGLLRAQALGTVHYLSGGMVTPEHRGRGLSKVLGMSLGEVAFAAGAEFVFTTTNNPLLVGQDCDERFFIDIWTPDTGEYPWGPALRCLEQAGMARSPARTACCTGCHKSKVSDTTFSPSTLQVP